VYVGDTARLPYGGKPQAMVRGFAFEWAGELVARGVKAIVVACNTASAAALPDLATTAARPRVGRRRARRGRRPRRARRASRSRRRRRRRRARHRRHDRRRHLPTALAAHGVRTWARACPLFVPIVEEGVSDGTIARLVAEHYLADRPLDGCARSSSAARTTRRSPPPARRARPGRRPRRLCRGDGRRRGRCARRARDRAGRRASAPAARASTSSPATCRATPTWHGSSTVPQDRSSTSRCRSRCPGVAVGRARRRTGR
jgi:hypothetical protein